MAKHHPGLIMCRKQPVVIANGNQGFFVPASYRYMVLFTFLAIFLDVGVEKWYCGVLACLTLVIEWKLLRNRTNRDKRSMEYGPCLPRDLVMEILSRVPAEAMTRFQSVCTEWDAISKNQRFRENHLAHAKSAAARERLVLMHHRIYLLRFNLDGLYDGIEPSIKMVDEISTPSQLDVSLVYHSNGLLLCISKDFKTFTVQNPYLRKTRSFSPQDYRGVCSSIDRVRLDCFVYAIGYEKTFSEHSQSPDFKYRVLRFPESCPDHFEIYDPCYWHRPMPFSETVLCKRGVSLEGNTYFYAREMHPYPFEGYFLNHFLVCFDFTSGKFGPPLLLPFLPKAGDVVTLSSIGEEQLAVLFQCQDTLDVQIWVTSKIDPEIAVWKGMLLSLDMQIMFSRESASFFVDEEKNAAVVFDKDEDTDENVAYIVGGNGYSKKVDLGTSSSESSYPQMCTYVPSLAPI